jgi:hypothetical protein
VVAPRVQGEAEVKEIVPADVVRVVDDDGGVLTGVFEIVSGSVHSAPRHGSIRVVIRITGCGTGEELPGAFPIGCVI